MIGVLVAVLAAMAMFGAALLMSWGLGAMIAAAAQVESDGAKPGPTALSTREVWVLAAIGPVVGGLVAMVMYLVRSALAHHLLPGDHVAQMVVGPIVGASVFAPMGLAFLTRRLPRGNIGILVLYMMSLQFVGPLAVMVIMHALGLRVYDLY